MSAPVPDSVLQALVDHLCVLYTPREREKTEDWMFRRLRLEKSQTADYAGEPLDIRRVPHARLIFDFLSDPYAEELNIMKSSAAALSTSTIAACIHRLEDDPCNIIYLITNREEAVKLSKTVWQPFLRQIFGAVVDTEEQGNLHLEINGCEIYSGSPTSGLMRNKQAGILVEDESDTMSDDVIGSGEDLEGSQKSRTKNVSLRKIIRLCTPLYTYDAKRANVSQPRTRIHRNFLRGDQREYRVPCPGCGIEHALHEDDFVCERARLLDGTYDLDLVETETEWKCPSCGHLAHEGSEKREMVNAGRWVPTVKGESRRVWSAKYTDWNSLLGSVTWGYIKKELIRTAGSRQAADIRRNYLAEPEDLTATPDARTDESILRHCGTHERGVCPVLPWHVVLTCDVQKGEEGISELRFPWMLAALHQRPDARVDAYIIDWGEVPEFDDLLMRSMDGKLHGIYPRPVPLRLSTSVEQAYRAQRGKDPPQHVYCTRGVIDSGYRARGKSNQDDESDASQESVYAFSLRSYSLRENRFLFCPVKGRAGVQINSLTVDSSVMVNGFQVPLLHYDDNAFKRDLYNIRLASDPLKPSALARDRGRIIFPRREDVDEKLVEQLKSERLADVEGKNAIGRKITVKKWTQEGPNDYGDCLKWVLLVEEVLRTAAIREQAQQRAAA